MKSLLSDRVPMVIVVCVAVFMSVMVPTSANAAGSRCRAATEFLASLYLNDCTLPYPDSGNIIDKVDTCHNYSSLLQQDITNPGYDYLMSVRILGITPSGQVSAPKTLSFSATMSNDCRLWNAYSLEGSLLDPNGNAYPITFGSGTLSDKSQTLNTDDYCFLQQLKSSCRWLDFSGSTTLPATAQSGLYSVQIHVKSIDTLLGRSTGLPSIDLPMNWSNIVDISGAAPAPTSTPTPSPTSAIDPSIPLTQLTVVNTKQQSIVCYSLDFKPEAVKQYGIIGTHWQISTRGGVVLDEYDWPLGLPGSGLPVTESTTNGAKVTGRASDGAIFYSYAFRNESVGVIYRCAVAINTTSGRGQYAVKDVSAAATVRDFNMVVPVASAAPSVSTKKRATKTQTIKCFRGKKLVRVSGNNAKCPTGYKKA